MKQRRWKNEAELLKAIDNAKALAVEKMANAEILKDAANNWFKVSARKDLSRADAEVARQNGLTLKKKSEILGRQALLLMENKLPKLGRRLAQMRTEIMPFLPDRSIVR